MKKTFKQLAFLLFALLLSAVLLSCSLGGLNLFATPTPTFTPTRTPTPTPTATPTLAERIYTNTLAGFSLLYPETWVYDEESTLILFASSQRVLDNSTQTPQDGAAVAVWTNVLTTADLPSSVDENSPVQVLDYIKDDPINETFYEVEPAYAWEMDGYPAASGVYRMTGTTGNPAILLMAVVIKDGSITIFYGVCEEEVWPEYRSELELIVGSVDFH